MSDVEVAGLKATVEAGFRESNRRFDEQSGKLDRLATEVRQTNGRVTRHDEQIKTLFAARPRDAVTFDLVRMFAQFGGWIVAGLLGLLKLVGVL